jgi:hypothetical protein
MSQEALPEAMQEESVKDLVENLRQIRKTKGDEAYAQAWKALTHAQQDLVLDAVGQSKPKYRVGIIGVIPFAIGLGLFVLSIKLAIVDSVIGGYDWTAFLWGSFAGFLIIIGAMLSMSELLSNLRSELRSRVV